MNPTGGPATHYELRLAGHLDDRWAAWFVGLTLQRQDDGSTTLRGPLDDQAQLHGVLAKVRDLGLTLISVESSIGPPPNHHAKER